MTKVRTRFAPSPTGLMHVGGVRTALFGWLLAKQSNGDFILRIEDTDKAREQAGAVDHICDSLKWLGIEWQEGPEVGGDFGPYKQSERLDTYKKYAEQLVDKGLAYADPYSSEELSEFRKQAQTAKKPFLYRDHRPENPPKWDGTQPLRFKIENVREMNWHDEVRGDLSAGPEALDDFIILKSDGFPTYNFAHIVDDHLMEITHVTRGEEFISSMPKFLALYEGLGFDLPKFVTAPPILGKNGGKKLSKRDGAQSVLEYSDHGYLPEAIMNFLATLGWNDGTEQEIFTPKELVEKFSIEHIHKNPAKFDDERLEWISGHHIRNMSLDEIFDRSDSFWQDAASKSDDSYKKAVLGLVKERLKHFDELPELTGFFFEDPTLTKDVFDLKKTDEATIAKYLEKTIETLGASDFSEQDLESRLRKLVEELGTKPGILFKAIRAGITGQNIAPGLFETLHVLGKEASLQRLNEAHELFK